MRIFHLKMCVKWSASLYMGERFRNILHKLMSESAGTEFYQFEDQPN